MTRARTVLLCIDTATNHVRRYQRNAWGRAESGAEGVIDGPVTPSLLKDLERLRVRPRSFDMDHIPPGAA